MTQLMHQQVRSPIWCRTSCGIHSRMRMTIVKVYVQKRMSWILKALHLNFKTSTEMEQVKEVLKISMS